MCGIIIFILTETFQSFEVITRFVYGELIRETVCVRDIWLNLLATIKPIEVKYA